MEKTFKNGAKTIEVLENGHALGTIRVTCSKPPVYFAHIYGTGNTQTQFDSEEEAKKFLLQTARKKQLVDYDTTSRKKNFSSWDL